MIQGTTSEVVLVVLLAVHDKILRVVGKELIEKLVVYASDQTHSTLQKAFHENKGAKFSKYELISSAIAGLTLLQSLYLRWFKLRYAKYFHSYEVLSIFAFTGMTLSIFASSAYLSAYLSHTTFSYVSFCDSS